MQMRPLWRMWWGGGLAMLSVGHLGRAFSQALAAIGSVTIPEWVSWVVFPSAGLAAVWLMRPALEERAEAQTPALPPWERLGGCHPKVAAKEPAAQAHEELVACGVYVSTYPFVDEADDEEEVL